MDANNERAAWALENIGNQLLALNEWLARYGETRLDPPLPSPGIHLIKFRELTAKEREYGQSLAVELERERRAEVLLTLLYCDSSFHTVICPKFPKEGEGYIIEVDDKDPGVGYMRRQPDGRARQFVGATVGQVKLENPDDDYVGWIWMRRFYDGKLFDCKLIVSNWGEGE